MTPFKNAILVLSVISIITGVFLSSCQLSGEKEEKAETKEIEAKIKAWETKKEFYKARQDSIAAFQKFKKESEEQISIIENGIAEFKTAFTNENMTVDEKLYEKLAELEQKNFKIKRKLETYKVEGQNNWTLFKNDFIYDLNELEQAFKNLTTNNIKSSEIQ